MAWGDGTFFPESNHDVETVKQEKHKRITSDDIAFARLVAKIDTARQQGRMRIAEARKAS